jgi:serine/threonine-protein phosphatase 4 regulatory subunit 4
MKNNYNSQILEKARVLCQDHEVEVRKIMASEVLGSICSVIPSDMFDLDIYEKVIELVYDSEISVKVVAIELVFQVSEFLSEDIKRTRMVSLFIELL